MPGSKKSQHGGVQSSYGQSSSSDVTLCDAMIARMKQRLEEKKKQKVD